MRFLSATQLFDGKEFLPKEKVLVLDNNNKLLKIANESELDAGKIEKHEGIICPGFVNTHCHLELSYLKGEIAEKKGLIEFAKGIMTKRMAFSPDKIKEAATQADTDMWNNGIVAVGDISNVTDSFSIKKESPVAYHTFIELLSLNPQNAEVVYTFGKDMLNSLLQMGLKGSLTPHAPYSVSPDLMRKVAALSAEMKTPLSIHNQESAEEDKFFKEKKGGFVSLYEFLKLPIDFFQSSGSGSLQSYLGNLSANKNIILVHDTFTPVEDITWANKFFPGLHWCLCPNANLYIENTLPDINNMINSDCCLCIGTDSLASNHQLSITSEMNVLLKNFKDLKPEQVLRWATFNGAQALMLSDSFGSFHFGKNSGLNLLSLDKRELQLKKKLA